MEKIPQPKTIPVIGNAGSLNPDAMVQSLIQLANEHGPIYRMQLPGQKFLIISSQELVQEVCDEKRFDKKVFPALLNIRAFTGDGLFTAETTEKNWGVAHRILMPVLGPQSLRKMFPPMLDIAEQLVLKWERQGPSHTIDLVDNMTRLTLDTIALCAFGYRFNSFYDKSLHPFIGAMVRSLVEAGARTRRLPIQNRLMLMTQRQFAEDVRTMHQLADELIAQKKRLLLSKLDVGVPNSPEFSDFPDFKDEEETSDILSAMIIARDPLTGESLSDENIRNQMVTFLIAGHETTSGLLSFAVNALLENPLQLKKAQEEVDRVLKRDNPRYEHLQQLSYLDQVLKETLRLWPTAPAFGVVPLERPAVLGGRFALDPDEYIFVLLPQLHRDPQVWGKDVLTFDPERMTPDKIAKLPPHSWKPFGNGQRACIGSSFALQEATLALALLLQRFDLQKADPTYHLRIKETLTLKPDGLEVRASKRKGIFASSSSTSLATELKVDPQATLEGAPGQALSRQAATGDKPLAVFYGSNCGSSEAFAKKIASVAASKGYLVQVAEMNKCVNNLPLQGPLIFITSSYEGQPPENAKAFMNWVRDASGAEFADRKYAVFGCGNRDWVRTYQAIPRELDVLLEKLGGKRFCPRAEADARGDFFGDFERWSSGIWENLAEISGEGEKSARDLRSEEINPSEFEVQFVPNPQEVALKQNNVLRGSIVKNEELVNLTDPLARSKHHVEIELPPGVSYSCGDYLAVMPVHSFQSVDRVLKKFGLSFDTSLILKAAQGSQTFLPVNQAVRVGDLLSTQVELYQPATRRQLDQLLAATSCPPEKAAMERLCKEETYQKEVLEKRVSVLDILELYESCQLSFASFLQMLPPLRPRQYSISSSPLWSGDHCTITVSIVQSPSWSGLGEYSGIASGFLANAQPGTSIGVMPRSTNPGFRLPTDSTIPIVMVCAGTGIAPFRGFLQERSIQKASGKTVGESLLFFGCDHPEVDYLYRQELEVWKSEGIVELYPAFSRGGDRDLPYVQDRVWKERGEIARLFQNGGKIYVCGDGKYMAPSVRETFGRIFQEVTGGGSEQTESFLSELEKTTRYVADVFS